MKYSVWRVPFEPTGECDKLEQYTRRENCRIHNFSVASDTDLSELNRLLISNYLSDLAANEGSTETRVNADTAWQSKPFSSSDISVCHPVKPKHGSKQQIIVRFVLRNKLYEVFRFKKYLESSPRYKGVFITDDLTPLRMKLFVIVKKDGATSNVFTRDGITHCTFKGKHVLVSSPDDLFQLDIDVDFAWSQRAQIVSWGEWDFARTFRLFVFILSSILCKFVFIGWWTFCWWFIVFIV